MNLIENIIKNYIYVVNFNDDIQESVYYNFIFLITNIQKYKNFIKIFGYINKTYITIIHSIKLYNLFISVKTIKLCGLIRNSICYMPFINFKPEGMQINLLSRNIKQIITNISEIKNDKIRENLHNIIYAKSKQQAQSAMYKLLLYEIAIQKNILQSICNVKTSKQIIMNNITMPFELNIYQQKVWNEIQINLQKNIQTFHLVYGDVGSGKTILAYLAACVTYNNNQNVAILAPNIALANQIYENFIKWNSNIKCICITNQTKKIKYEHDCAIYIGTHALLFRELPLMGLVIVDEQHKFGVHQRNKLINNNTDMLMLTATPIPRTLNMVLSNFLSYSTLHTEKRKNHILVYNMKNIDNIMHQIIEKSYNEKIFWIETTIENAENRYETIRNIQSNCYLVHSNIKERATIMNQFIKQTSGILIGTTVLEVGIDSDTNIIVIINADMLGACSIHQLNGRVGRRNKPGYTFLIGKNTLKLTEIQKLNNGYEVAQWDLKKRGGSNIFHHIQSGFHNFIFNYTLNNDLTWSYNDEIPTQLLGIIDKVHIENNMYEFFVPNDNINY